MAYAGAKVNAVLGVEQGIVYATSNCRLVRRLLYGFEKINLFPPWFSCLEAKLVSSLSVACQDSFLWVLLHRSQASLASGPSVAEVSPSHQRDHAGGTGRVWCRCIGAFLVFVCHLFQVGGHRYTRVEAITTRVEAIAIGVEAELVKS